jgi:fatty acid desaturase
MMTFKNFRKDPFFFLKYFTVQMIVMIGMAYLVKDISHSGLELSFSLLVFLPLSFVFGLQVPVALHNAVHFNIKPRLLNEIVGEICGFFVLFGMAPFRISHVLHHANSDDEDLDPHPPMGKSFLYFLTTTQMNTIRVIGNQYFSIHRKTRKTISIMALQMPVYYVGLFARLFIWWKVLGPTYFVAFFIPAYVTNLVVFAHINWATHQTRPDGEVVIVNLNHNLYYKTVNFIGAGAYYHLNHHLRPGLYNPATMEAPKSEASPALSEATAS